MKRQLLGGNFYFSTPLRGLGYGPKAQLGPVLERPFLSTQLYLSGMRTKTTSKRQTARPHPTGTTANLTLSLAPYEGEWTFVEAAHLLRRTTFGPTKTMIEQVIEEGLDATILRLFEDQPLPEPPKYYGLEEADPYVGPDESWVDATYPEDISFRTYRRRSLAAWTMAQMMEEGISLREKMTLFWVNHFALGEAVRDPKYHYRYVTSLRTYAWGNFRELIKVITIDPAMLRFLNGNQNRAVSPNENYARELLELYTIGKGEVAGPGDYTNYTEEDVRAMARVLTGWRDRGYYSRNPNQPMEVEFVERFHDTDAKQLSHRFDSIVIENGGDQEYQQLIDIIFSKEEVARFISRKLYRWFLYYDINAEIEAHIIEPLAQLIIDNDYELAPALQTLLRSQHFFDILSVGPMIKHPLDYTVGLFKQVARTEPEDREGRYYIYNRLFNLASGLGMSYYSVPQVAGWKAFYQAPLYTRTWITSTTLRLRHELSEQWGNRQFNQRGNIYRFDPLAYIATFEDALDPNAMIAEATQLLLPRPLYEDQLLALKDILLGGLPDFEWTLEYGNYLGNPEDDNLRRAVESKLRALFTAIFHMAEYPLS
ncbi:MAG: DUF1800 domain-containing protein [Bacteroidetes bacterium]|nr:MAG: DUF1800 domain-containing protein [Bacteroidota bacterium]